MYLFLIFSILSNNNKMSLRPERERKPTVNAVMDKYEHLKKMGEALEEAGRNPDGILDYVCCLDK